MPATREKRGTRERAWSDDELASAVHAYVRMLDDELSGARYVLKDVVTTLQKYDLANRTLRSVELRMQNISSVLFDLKFPLVPNCPPAHNVGTRVRRRIVALLYRAGIADFEAYAKTAAWDVLEERVSTLRKREVFPLPKGTLSPRSESKSVRIFVRDPAVKAWVLKESRGICEGCKFPASFLGKDELPYLEVHHVVPLAKGGSDTVQNAVALCPNCHMRCHYSIDRDEFKLRLYETIDRLLIEAPGSATLTDEFI